MPIAFTALMLAAAAPSPAAAETPKTFMQRLYAGYRNPDYSPFKHPERVFAPNLLAAIKEDERLAKGEVGYLDGDPVCQCQDADGLKAAVTRVKLQGADKARVSVSIGMTGYKPRPAEFSLLRTRAGWRIADVSSPDEKSLLAALQKSNREARAKN